MTRLEKVYEGLCAHSGSKGITASELAGLLGLARANCSFDLNRLCEEGKAKKQGTKPIYYLPLGESKPPGSSFLDFIHRNPSLSKCGDLAKAAVLYPPNGMNILLLGETGVGKSMFATLIHDFSCSLKKNASGSSLITFNCADYANNPQLLLAQLFGVVKGAYTGADQDKSGLFELADGGILFLDEVHRLPAEGQEMLFTYMDRGVFRRLGETTCERIVMVMLICATTEEPDSSLLQTFRRRLPVVIHLPNLSERSLEERQQLIALFFSQESTRLKAPIFVSVNSMRALLGYYCPGNIGQLSGDIQLLCARAYADFISGDQEKIQITSFSLPPHIRNGFLNERSRKDLWNRFSIGQGWGFMFRPDGPLPDFSLDTDSDIYELMGKQTSNMKRVGIPAETLSTRLYLLTVCITGDGSAYMLRQLLEKQLDLDNCCCEVVQMSISDPRKFQQKVSAIQNKGRIVAVVGAFQTELEVPHIPLTEVLSGNGISTLQKRLNWENLRFRMVDTIADLLDQLDAVSAISQTHDMVSRLVLKLNVDLSEEMMTGIFSHLIFMLNRLKKSDTMPLFPNKESMHKRYPGVVAAVERECRMLGKYFNVVISDDEICYIAAFFTKENFNQLVSTWNR